MSANEARLCLAKTANNGQALGSTGIPRSQKWEWLGSAFELWTDELCTAYGFRRDSWFDHEGRRTIELLGPDSPGEYVFTFPLWRLREEHLEQLLRDVVLWVDAAGREYTGAYAPGVVPEEYRNGGTSGERHAHEH